jgi:hypothetical protein
MTRRPVGVAVSVEDGLQAALRLVVHIMVRVRLILVADVVVMVHSDVKDRRPADRPGGGQRGDRSNREGSLQDTPHETSIPDRSGPVKGDTHAVVLAERS